MTRNGKKKKKRGNDIDGFDRIQTRINEKNKTREQAKKKKVEVKERKTITGERKMWKGARACKQTCVSRTCWRRCARETYRVSLFFNHLAIVCDFRAKFSSKDLFFFVVEFAFFCDACHVRSRDNFHVPTKSTSSDFFRRVSARRPSPFVNLRLIVDRLTRNIKAA